MEKNIVVTIKKDESVWIAEHEAKKAVLRHIFKDDFDKLFGEAKSFFKEKQNI